MKNDLMQVLKEINYILFIHSFMYRFIVYFLNKYILCIHKLLCYEPGRHFPIYNLTHL
jgi:hypothetical protein